MANSLQRDVLPAFGESVRRATRRGWIDFAALAAAAAIGAGTAPVAAAQDATAGRQKALQCQACHGLDGLAKLPGAPHIAGQVPEYLAMAMRAYKSGARQNEMMSVAMRQLSDEDIEDLAAYYAGLSPKAKSEP